MPHVFTPWRYEEELLQTRDDLFKEGLSQRREAVQRVEMWTMRGNCPHAVASTAYLTDAMLQYESEQWSNASMRSLFAGTFARFVTGFCDIGQGSSSRTAMAEVAKLYGMPASFISLRHEAAHKELPSLLRLERACREALDWLWHYYWAPLGPLDDGHEPPTPVLLKKTQLALKQFLQDRKQELQTSKDLQAAPRCCSELLAISEATSRWSFSMMLAECLAAKGTVLLSKKRAESDPMEGAFALFDSLLRTLGTHFERFLPRLVHSMLAKVLQAQPVDGPYCDGVCQWILHIFTDRRWTRSQTAAQVQPCRRVIVQTCSARKGNKWADRLCVELVRTGSSRFQEAMQMHVDDAPPNNT